MNGRPALFTVADWDARLGPEDALESWLDRGAHELDDVIEHVRVRIVPGPVPRMTLVDGADVSMTLQRMLTSSLTFYDVTIAAPELLTRGFIDEELGGDPRSALIYRVDVADLRARMDETPHPVCVRATSTGSKTTAAGSSFASMRCACCSPTARIERSGRS